MLRGVKMNKKQIDTYKNIAGKDSYLPKELVGTVGAIGASFTLGVVLGSTLDETIINDPVFANGTALATIPPAALLTKNLAPKHSRGLYATVNGSGSCLAYCIGLTVGSVLKKYCNA